MREYILSICACALISCICTIIIPSGAYNKYVKFVCGLVMVTVMLNPLMKISFADFDFGTYALQQPGEDYAAQGRAIIEEACKKRCEQELATLDGVMGVTVTVGEDYTPVAITIFARGGGEELRAEAARRLGVEKEMIHVENGL